MAERGSIVNFHSQRVPKSGRAFPVSLTQTVICDSEGREGGYSLILRDIRAQAKQDELIRRSERFAAVSVMAGGLAHEINNPLAVIRNRLECMEQEVHDRCDHCFLEEDFAVLCEHTERLQEVTRDLLGFAQQDEEKPAPVRLDQISFRVARLLERTFASRNISLTVKADPDLPQPMGSAKAIEIVCMNLLLNAADATPSGGAVTLETRSTASEDAVELEVSDTGSGVPVEFRDRIFEPFFTTKATGQGTGLGLAVCRSIVERHRGEIRLTANEGGGSRFVVSLPLRTLELLWNRQRY
jgi:two-component system NtrC family sensor kinase